MLWTVFNEIYYSSTMVVISNFVIIAMATSQLNVKTKDIFLESEGVCNKFTFDITLKETLLVGLLLKAEEYIIIDYDTMMLFKHYNFINNYTHMTFRIEKPQILTDRHETCQAIF